MKEVWMPVVGYEGIYAVSNKGRVKSLDRYVKHKRSGTMRIYGKVLNPGFTMGYPMVNLLKNGIAKGFYIHKLVLLAFDGPCPAGHVCRHFPDQSKLNNNIANLSWSTRKVNESDKNITGNANRGQRHGMAKLTDCRVKKIRMWDSLGIDIYKIAEVMGVHFVTVLGILKRKAWKHI